MNSDPALVEAFAPTGALRASINLGNPILANRHPGTGEAFGVSVDLAREFARELGAPLELVVFDTALKSVEAVTDERADFGFFAVDPKRGETIAFTAPYVLIEGFYLVREDSPVRANADVDRADTRVVVGQGSAYDLYLTRELKAAQIVRAPTSQVVVQTFVDQGFEVAAGVKQQLLADASRFDRLRLLDERFMVIRQAMGVSKRREPKAAAVLAAFVERMKASGFVADALARHGIGGASVAPAA
ncbi:transporter substrate-binding domain-containing protein [Pararobbsia silviterrae]|uniref:ABC transporter substrate-binding protein n=1 Tax=Pararobbsia silviterrae TaxID=1792498 RepID=A0A494Y3J0_9BURK|nr:transporter substrate-binding domain-containing protein [Pararobbsia silviterrae]RKP56578.1 ABC transporter substrate-binding protein [Pararobbsia silviterrae]